MKSKTRVCLSLAMMMLVSTAYAQRDQKKIHKTFPKKETVRIKTVSGGCIVRKGKSNQIEVDLVYSVHPEDAFEPEFDERTTILDIEENWYGSSSGRVEWTVIVPEGTEIEFSTASGDLSVQGLKSNVEASTASGDATLTDLEGDLSVSTASGDVVIKNAVGQIECSTASGEIQADHLQGEIEFSTASGDIDIAKSSGAFDFSCASGDIDASDMIFEEESEFSTASGDMEVSLAETPDVDLEFSTASGRITLDYQGFPIKGMFIFTAREDRGEIRAPFPFDEEEEVWRHGQLYMRKSFTKGGSAPRMELSTASGTVTLKK